MPVSQCRPDASLEAACLSWPLLSLDEFNSSRLRAHWIRWARWNLLHALCGTPNASSADLQPLPEQGAFGLLMTFQLARTGGGGVLLQDTDRGGSWAAPFHGS
jgi:hypothetical protein